MRIAKIQDTFRADDLNFLNRNIPSSRQSLQNKHKDRLFFVWTKHPDCFLS